LRYNLLPKTQFIGQNICYEPVCASTSSWAAQCLQRTPLAEGTVFITDHQYQGRGQRGRVWLSEPGQNLTFSIVLYPTFLPLQQRLALHWVTALALHQAVSAYIPHALAIKWPNDLYHTDHKLGGILIENEVTLRRTLRATIIGIGLNVNQKRFSFAGPTSLALVCQRWFDLQQLLVALLEALEYRYKQLQVQGAAALRTQYLSHLYWINEVHTFRDAQQTFQGKIKTVDATGQLVIERTDGTCRAYSMQEITFLA